MADLTEISVLDERRCADASIRGYLYQVCLGVERWLGLDDGQVLLLEGDEDLDRLLGADGQRICEQVKHCSGSGLGFADRAVTDSLVTFVTTFAETEQRGDHRQFVFTSNAARRRRGDIDPQLLEAWHQPERRQQVTAAVRAVASKAAEHAASRSAAGQLTAEKVTAAIAWLDDDTGRWPSFIAAVQWNLQAGEVDQVLGRIRDRLRQDDRSSHLDAGLLADRLVSALLQASAVDQPGLRQRDPSDLARLIELTTGDLERWARTPAARRLRGVIDELQALQAILLPGTRELTRQLRNPGRLLQAAYEVIPFYEPGRRAELQALADWCAGPRRDSVLLLTGAGGCGKTRLLIEGCRRLAAQGWHTGFLARGADTGPLLCGDTPRLCVIDYAETRLDEVGGLLRRMASRQRGPRLRLVLLARAAGDWWRQLAREDAAVADLLESSPSPAPVPPLVTRREERLAIARQAAAAFAAVLEQPPVAVPDDLPERLPGETVLYLHMAALLAVLGEASPAAGLLNAVLDHETRFWRRQIEALRLDGAGELCAKEAIGPVAATLTLVGGSADRARAEEWVAAAGHRLTPPVAAATATLLRRLYPGDAGRWLGVVEPDLLGEHLVAREISTVLLDTILDRADDGETRRALTVLTRLAASSRPHESLLAASLANRLPRLAAAAVVVAIETGDPIGRLLAAAVADSGDTELARQLESVLPRYTVALREVKVVVAEILLARQRSVAVGQGEDGQVELARLANNLGIRLSELGHREDALAASQEAVAIRRRLAESRPDAFLPALAMSLNNLGAMLSELGRRENALTATQEAVETYLRLAESRPDTFLPYLAKALSNLGDRLAELGRLPEASRAAHEATSILAPFFHSLPPAHASLMALVVRDYVRLAQAAGEQPDHELVGPIREALAALEGEPQEE